MSQEPAGVVVGIERSAFGEFLVRSVVATRFVGAHTLGCCNTIALHSLGCGAELFASGCSSLALHYCEHTFDDLRYFHRGTFDGYFIGLTKTRGGGVVVTVRHLTLSPSVIRRNFAVFSLSGTQS